MPQGDLTSLEHVKQWLSVTTSNGDPVLSRLITSLSASIRSSINRYNLSWHTCTDIRNGMGTTSFVLANWPVTDVVEVKIGETIIPKGILSNGVRSAGWYLSPYDGNPPGNAQTVELWGFSYVYGVNNVSITYNAGYLADPETFDIPLPDPVASLATNGATAAGATLHFASVPAGVAAGQLVYDTTTSGVIPAGTTVLSKTSTTVVMSANVTAGGVLNGDNISFLPTITEYTLAQAQGIWGADNGVTADDGTPYVKVSSNPGSGQYMLDTSIVGGYWFSTLDAGNSVTVLYSFVPPDLEQACIEWVGFRNSYRTRIGVRSKSLASEESISYDTSGVPSFVAQAIQPYESVLVLL